MLVAYHDSYLLLIAICALYCILVLAYNLFIHLTQKQRDRHQRKRVQKIVRLLNDYPQSGQAAQKKMRRKLRRIFLTPKGLLGLFQALEVQEWKKSEDIPPCSRQLLCSLLTDLYQKRYRRAEAYIQSLLIDLIIICDATSSRLSELLIQCLTSQNILLRVEALRCICALRNRRMVDLALEKISQDRLPFSNRLITDTLMSFRGNMPLLLNELWKNFEKYSCELQVSIIQVLADQNDSSYAEEMLKLILHEKTDMEVRIAAFKYFSSVHEPECVPVLAKYLSHETWEYAAVAANVLGCYDCAGIFDVLYKGIMDRNWFVRSNCAKALVKSCSPQQIEQALQVPDRYGWESVYYALNLAKKEVSAV